MRCGQQRFPGRLRAIHTGLAFCFRGEFRLATPVNSFVPTLSEQNAKEQHHPQRD